MQIAQTSFSNSPGVGGGREDKVINSSCEKEQHRPQFQKETLYLYTAKCQPKIKIKTDEIENVTNFEILNTNNNGACLCKRNLKETGYGESGAEQI